MIPDGSASDPSTTARIEAMAKANSIELDAKAIGHLRETVALRLTHVLQQLGTIADERTRGNPPNAGGSSNPHATDAPPDPLCDTSLTDDRMDTSEGEGPDAVPDEDAGLVDQCHLLRRKIEEMQGSDQNDMRERLASALRDKEQTLAVRRLSRREACQRAKREDHEAAARTAINQLCEAILRPPPSVTITVDDVLRLLTTAPVPEARHLLTRLLACGS